MKPLYVFRKVLNGREIIDWAKDAGFEETLDPDDLHLTVCFSKSPVDWDSITPSPQGAKAVVTAAKTESLGNDGAVVLMLKPYPYLLKRWQYYIDQGASWDYDSYKPHISISYKGGPEGETYEGPIILGHETMKTLNTEWAKDVKHV